MRNKIKQLKISYFRDKIKSYPDIRLGYRNIRNEVVPIVMLYEGKRRVEVHKTNSKRGIELVRIKEEADNCKRILSKLESEWVELYGIPCEYMRIRHYGDTENKRFFDQLSERCNTYDSMTAVCYNGKIYKSKLEGDFATLMDEYGIMYKYEPEVVTGTNTVNPDFVLYLPWLDLIILVEIFGAMSDVAYLNRNKLKPFKYAMGEWILGWNFLAMCYSDKTTYIREMVMEDIENIELRRCLEILNSRKFQ
ncbi:MAG: hypothetical protein K5643_00285 [Saccharofermentans sp.]|nr:hypothetical protein [Saccharofermentans sp.]